MRTPLARLREVVQEALDAGESQAALARRLQVAQPTIWGWLNETKLDPRATVLGRVCRILGVNGHWLLTEQGEKRALVVGGDAVFADGRQAGRQDALQAIQGLPPISAAADIAARALEAAEALEQGGGPVRQRPAKPRTSRPRRTG